MEPHFPPHFLHMPRTPCGYGIHGLVGSGVLYNSELEGSHKKTLVSPSCFFGGGPPFPWEYLRRRHTEEGHQSLARLGKGQKLKAGLGLAGQFWTGARQGRGLGWATDRVGIQLVDREGTSDG